MRIKGLEVLAMNKVLLFCTMIVSMVLSLGAG